MEHHAPVPDDWTAGEMASQLADAHARADAAETRVRRLDAEVQRARTLPWRVAAAVLAVGWAGVLLLGLAWGSFVVLADDLYCERTPGSSDYGDLSWSIVPPGPQCSWPGADVRGPTPVMSAWLLFLLALGGLAVWLARHGRVAQLPDPEGMT